MSGYKFDPAKTARLDDPGRFDDLRPDVMWAALGIDDPRSIVDVGAGTGLFSERFAELAPHATVYAVDRSVAMLDWVREHRGALVGSGRVVPVLSDEVTVPLPDGIADAVVMINLHHELDDPLGTYREALRLLNVGGRLMVADWAPRETPKGPPLAVRVTPKRLEELLECVGFGDVHEHGGLPNHTLVTATRV
jgi:ubiquinone/menaquinone biosynthesis C-methylase UbiE